jgi:Fe-S-cluster containining protein
MKTCCQTSEIYVTRGDVARITDHTGVTDFHEPRVPANALYLDQDDDPTWRDHVFRRDGSRRVLKRQANGDCTFLGPHGCRLPLEVRPLVCRIYPFEYDEQGIHDELAVGCPLELLQPDQGLIAALEMNIDDARRWHRQLYEEVRMEDIGSGVG